MMSWPLQVVWCPVCKCAILWSLTTDAESPATLSHLFHTHVPEGDMRLVYDNACNLLVHVLKRDPEVARRLDATVDALHYRGHKHCCHGMDSGAQLAVERSSACACACMPLLNKPMPKECIAWKHSNSFSDNTACRVQRPPLVLACDILTTSAGQFKRHNADDPFFGDLSLSEQENKLLGAMKAAALQPTYLWLVKYMLYRMARRHTEVWRRRASTAAMRHQETARAGAAAAAAPAVVPA
jgi:hypothetical protein